MNGESFVNTGDVIQVIRRVDVFSLFFPLLRKTLLVDLRTGPEYPPLVRLVPMARSSEERLEYLHRLRPGLPRLEEVTLIPWNRSSGGLVKSGVFDALLERVAGTGDRRALQACQLALQELQRLEKQELGAAVRGENYHTLWARPR